MTEPACIPYMSESRDNNYSLSRMAKTNPATYNEVLLQSAMFEVKTVGVVAGSDARRLFSTGFTSPAMLLKCFVSKKTLCQRTRFSPR